MARNSVAVSLQCHDRIEDFDSFQLNVSVVQYIGGKVGNDILKIEIHTSKGRVMQSIATDRKIELFS
jgi:hypothetical protein